MSHRLPALRITQACVALSLALGGACPHCIREDPEEVWWQSASRLDGTAGTPTADSSVSPVTNESTEAGSDRSLPESTSVTVSEVKVDPPGTDGNYEFVELRGDPLSQLSSHWLIALEGDSDANPGRIDLAMNLSECGTGPCQFDAQGILLIVADPPAIDTSAGSIYSTKDLANGKLENGTTTLMVLVGLSPSDLGSDWDVDDDGLLELPAHVTIRHAVAWTDGGSGDRAYCTEIAGPKPKAQAAWRCVETNGAATWRWGELQGESSSLVMNLTRTSPESLEHATLTPGSVNDCGAPQVSASKTTNAAGDVTAAGTASFEQRAPSIAGSGGIDVPRSDGCTPTDLATELPSAAAGGTSLLPIQSPGKGSDATSEVVTHSSRPSIGSTATPAVAGCGGAGGARIVARAIPQAGSTGWWSPNPFASPLAGGMSSSILHLTATSGAKTTESTPPQLPGSCVIGPSSRRRAPNPLLIVAPCLALLRAIPRRRRAGR